MSLLPPRFRVFDNKHPIQWWAESAIPWKKNASEIVQEQASSAAIPVCLCYHRAFTYLITPHSVVVRVPDHMEEKCLRNCSRASLGSPVPIEPTEA